MTRRLTLFARDSFADSPTTDEVELNGVPFRRTGSRTNTLRRRRRNTASPSSQRSSTRYDNTWVAFDRPEIFLTGGWIHALRSELTYQLSEHVSAGGEYGYRRASLDERQREFDFQDAGGVVHFRLGPHTSGQRRRRDSRCCTTAIST